MSRARKIDIRIREEADGFTAEVIRRGTSRGTTVERARAGFPSDAEARTWAAAELAEYLALRARRADRSKMSRQRSQKRRRVEEAWLAAQTLQGLAQAFQNKTEHAAVAYECLKTRLEILWREVAYRVLRNGATEQVAIALADEQVGRNWTQRLQKALSGEADCVHEGVDRMAVAHAQRLLQVGLAQQRGRPEPD